MVRQHHQLNGHEFEQTPGDSKGQGSLVCCSPWGHKELDMTQRLNNNRSLGKPNLEVTKQLPNVLLRLQGVKQVLFGLFFKQLPTFKTRSFLYKTETRTQISASLGKQTLNSQCGYLGFPMTYCSCHESFTISGQPHPRHPHLPGITFPVGGLEF